MKTQLIFFSSLFIAFCFTSLNIRLQAQCNSFLNVTAIKSGVRIGDLDISGNKITVEGIFNRTQTYDLTFSGGEIVSKHQDPTNVNYLLRPNSASITTTMGFFRVDAPCNIELNKTYHIAMVYDGSTLKFYRNGFLMKQVSATGNLVTNNYITTIGTTADLTTIYPSDFLGYINEVRIWSSARTQEEIKSTMNTPLVNPSSLTDLKAYYIFNSLTNLQGNSNWNGTLINNASISTTNPSCSGFNIDSCGLNVTLPIKLNDFNVNLLTDSVSKISFSVFNSNEASLFEIETSHDGISYSSLAKQTPQNTQQLTSYFYNHNFKGQKNLKSIFYRIRIIDKLGKLEFSNVLKLEMKKGFQSNTNSSTIFPNPVNNTLIVTLDVAKKTNVKFRVIDITGKEILSQQQMINAGKTVININEIGSLQPGSYVLQIVSENSIENKKFLKL